MKISDLQREIERIYGLDGVPAVEDFLISSSDLLKYLPSESRVGPQVLFQVEDGEVSLAVHIGDGAMKRVNRDGLEAVDLADFCSVAEEISHFVYLLWKVQNEHPVSLLDVEVQGEIDKFLLASILFTEETNLFPRMFERVTYEEGLDTNQHERYVEANRLGGKYCRMLSDRLVEGELPSDMLARLRAFYRRTSPSRLSEVTHL